MIDPKNDLKFTTAGDYIDEWKKKSDEGYEPELESQPTGTETWQTKANAKNTVPKYYSPTELLSMKLDSMGRLLNDYNERLKDLELGMQNLNTRLSNMSSEMFNEVTDDEIYNKPKGER